MIRKTLSVLCLCALTSLALAQGTSIHANVIARAEEHESTALRDEVRSAFDGALLIRGRDEGRESQLQLYVHPTLVSIAGDEVVVVTVFLGSRMSDDMIEEGAKHEIWYAGGSVPEDVEGGTFVRQYMTKDVLGRMVTVHDTQSFTFPVSELDAEINRYLDRLIEWMSCTSTNTCE